jgi:hypothetical protein
MPSVKKKDFPITANPFVPLLLSVIPRAVPSAFIFVMVFVPTALAAHFLFSFN